MKTNIGWKKKYDYLGCAGKREKDIRTFGASTDWTRVSRSNELNEEKNKQDKKTLEKKAKNERRRSAKEGNNKKQ